MRVKYNNPTLPGGISRKNRELLTTLVRSTRGPFTIEEGKNLLSLSGQRTRRLLAYLVARRWLARVRPGVYVVSPMEMTKPNEWREDPWIVATKTLTPCYIGGWSACEHWGLTEQIFREIVVFTSRRLRGHVVRIQETTFRIKRVSPEKMFGTKVVWRKQVRVNVSDPSRTLADILNDPQLGGGIKHVAGIVAAYFNGNLRDDRLLMEYATKLDNRTIYKRLGYLIEVLNLDAKVVLDQCRSRISSGVTFLDPSVGKKGRIVRRWNLLLNVEIKGGEVGA
jgi:predicted transcriptional regulator of viral defense system